MANKINLNVTCAEQLPSPYELKLEHPINLKQLNFIENTRMQITKVLDNEDPRCLMIVGPCSIHDIQAAAEYAAKLKNLAREVSDTFLVIMRVYFEKPRTTVGWKGILYDPHLDGSQSIHYGLNLTRKLLLELASLEIPAAAEFLDPVSALYFGDLISWGCIGARTSESQTHRQMASGLPMPVAFKNSTAGNIDVAINGVLSASMPHTFIGINEMGKVSMVHTLGNPHCHIALRGGENKPNYDPVSINQALKSLNQANLPLRIIVDCSHDNSNRKHEQQPLVFKSIIHQILEGERNIRGVILESNLFEGNQPMSKDPSNLRYAVSLTDPCLDWAATEQLIRWGYDVLKKADSEIEKAEDGRGKTEGGRRKAAAVYK